MPATTEAEFDFVEHLKSGPNDEYVVRVSNDTLPLVALAQLYRDRADCENVFDEIKNQWGWAGFVTRELKRCRIIARLIALIYKRKGARSGRCGQSGPAEAHAMTHNGPFKKAVDARVARFNCSF